MIKNKNSIIFYTLLVITSIAVIFPVLYAFVVSFMDTKEISRGQFYTLQPSIKNYAKVIVTIPILRYMYNSFAIAIIVMIVRLITCSLAAFAFVFIPFKGKNFFFLLFISTMMVPWQATVIPNYLTIIKLDLLNSYAGLTLPFLANALGMFLMRQHFKTLPSELAESAEIDGCGRFRFYASIVLPLSTPVLATCAVNSFLNLWNMYLWPLLVTTSKDSRTIQIGLKTLISQEAGTDWGLLMAGVVCVVLPSLVLLYAGQKQLKKGLMAGAVKG